MQKSTQAKGPHPAGVNRRARESVARAKEGPAVAGGTAPLQVSKGTVRARARNGESTGPREAATSSIGAAAVCADSRSCNRSNITSSNRRGSQRLRETASSGMDAGATPPPLQRPQRAANLPRTPSTRARPGQVRGSSPRKAWRNAARHRQPEKGAERRSRGRAEQWEECMLGARG